MEKAGPWKIRWICQNKLLLIFTSRENGYLNSELNTTGAVCCSMCSVQLASVVAVTDKTAKCHSAVREYIYLGIILKICFKG